MLTVLNRLTDPLVDPFEAIPRSIFADPTILKGFDLAAAIALVVVFVVSRLVDRAGRTLQKRYAAPPRRF